MLHRIQHGGMFIMEEYEVRMGGSIVGRVTMSDQGLYRRICCSCRLSGEVVCRLVAVCGDTRQSIGILVPQADGFGLDTRLPAKRLPAGTVSFELEPKHSDLPGGVFVPIRADEPFAYLSRLKDSFLCFQEGVQGIIVSQSGD